MRWLNRNRPGYILILLCLFIVGRACVFRPATSFPGVYFNRSTNAAWLSVDWFNVPHTSDEITALASDLSQRQITYIFVFASYLELGGEFTSTYSHSDEFVRALREVSPGLTIQAWVGLPLTSSNSWVRGYVDLSDPAIRQKISKFCADLIAQSGSDGVHLDPEPVPDNDADLLKLLEDVRGAIGPDPVLSIAAPRIWPVFPDVAWPVVGQIAWHSGYYREVAKRVDQIAVMTYDSGSPLPELYRQWTRFQVIEISRALKDMDVDIFFGIPTSEEKTWTLWPATENMTNGLQGVIDGLNDGEAFPFVVKGVAIYPHWETQPDEWSVYDSLWLDK